MEKLKEYIENWNTINGVKPCNEDAFIDGFIKLIDVFDDRDITFDGEGSYFGKQVTLHYNRAFFGDDLINFEIAYNKENISVYSAKHGGFWTPEYLRISIEHPRFNEIKTKLFKLLTSVFGI